MIKRTIRKSRRRKRRVRKRRARKNEEKRDGRHKAKWWNMSGNRKGLLWGGKKESTSEDTDST